MANFLQWNMRGLQANREDLTLLLSSVKPTIVALQETNIGKHHKMTNFWDVIVGLRPMLD